MAIYHLEAKVVSRGAGRSAVAASAYLSCSRLYNDYDGIQHDYTKKQGLVWQGVFLPKYAPQEWRDREKLWNAVEEVETAKDSRLAREFVVALPVELSRGEQIELLQEFIREQFVSDGMCADAAIHDTDGHNPHAHTLLTVRPLDEQGNWQYKTEKEYLCVRNGEERGFTAAEFKEAQAEGWEKQYPYKVGKRKLYMAPSAAEAQGYVRADKHPKSTRYGRQNPIAERWNSEEQLVEWRKAWADVTNRYLERYGHDERIDHRSHADRGLSEQPTIHEGVVAHALEKKGIISDRCEINRQIKADNALLRELKATVKKLMQAVKNTVPAIAEAMEKLRSSILIFSYQLRYIGVGKNSMGKRIDAVKPELERYVGLVQQIKEKSKERKALLAEKKETLFYQIPKLHDLTRRIAELTEELEELKTEKEMLLRSLDYTDDVGISDVKKEIATLESALQKLSEQEAKYSAELDDSLKQYAELKEQAAGMDAAELMDARLAVREEKERSAADRVKAAYGEKYDPMLMHDSKRDVANLLHEEAEVRSVREFIRRKQQQQTQQKQNKKKNRDSWER
ncbi:MobQ family relaxase [Anaerotruncus colihominis]|uniref:MobA/MobL family protein n=1 Tax=Anaerotruncus colihominis DSM 17241 TaxID=445972 RepID=B0PEM1_9FIRM|nr:MobQ family relaxase [Anaerotruncus colihominis]EDS09804.1 MobA/MobL family protein [Anaerotruncus colihominis DSM 17241]UWN73878.1 MobA/MobL family protein [Anaerotruncus colihominis]